MVDTGTLPDLITSLRQTTEAQSITPETVGSLLQKIVDTITTCAERQFQEKMSAWFDSVRGFQVISGVRQGTADSNHVFLDLDSFNLDDGTSGTLSARIQQATTERAGAMRAQQVIDLNKAKADITDINTKIDIVSDTFSQISDSVTENNGIIDQIKADVAALKENDAKGSDIIDIARLVSDVEVTEQSITSQILASRSSSVVFDVVKNKMLLAVTDTPLLQTTGQQRIVGQAIYKYYNNWPDREKYAEVDGTPYVNRLYSVTSKGILCHWNGSAMRRLYEATDIYSYVTT